MRITFLERISSSLSVNCVEKKCCGAPSLIIWQKLHIEATYQQEIWPAQRALPGSRQFLILTLWSQCRKVWYWCPLRYSYQVSDAKPTIKTRALCWQFDKVRLAMWWGEIWRHQVVEHSWWYNLCRRSGIMTRYVIKSICRRHFTYYCLQTHLINFVVPLFHPAVTRGWTIKLYNW